ncbi:hypothetical protein CROQUDRAFT_94591 [Cronartium quercuum f. sp. fusiforme G11]|uniref:Retrovirus-related Pol polyprotein from transposon TNT 1-94-like beta-barrel domain-containing protein n=1 Tax=Cronartium quercuum f. sp. fusiforme G11 TaxID=708437 RepID=A0A9P6TA52_9BASI|nr:hypothetical protein CROQUDRAFT_94591 [Cronartium quercuum f. sp. fusiforme G11]
MNYYTAREAFNILCKHHGDSGGLSTASLFFDLVNLRLQPNGSIAEHIHKFRQLHNRFVSNQWSTPGITISKHYIAILLLKSLPVEFNPLVQTTLASNFESISLNHIYALLQMEISRCEVSTQQDPTTHAALVTATKKSKPHQEPKKPPICSLGHVGHTDEHCNTRIQAEEKEMVRKYKELMVKKSNSAQLAIDKLLNNVQSPTTPTQSTSPSAPSYYDEAFVAITPSSDQSRIITLDTGATANMFGNKSLLSDIENITPSPINVASKEGKIYARSQGTATIGKLKVYKVLHASELAVNLISVGVLYDMGYKINWTMNSADVVDSTGKFLIRFY